MQAKSRELVRVNRQVLDLKTRLISDLNLQSPEPVEERTVAADSNLAIGHLRRMKILTESDWVMFREIFEQAFPNFGLRLKTAFPDLSASDTRFFMMLKLGFESREIAEELGISTDSVWKGRYRLRKKLGKVENAEFNAFVLRFS